MSLSNLSETPGVQSSKRPRMEQFGTQQRDTQQRDTQQVITDLMRSPTHDPRIPPNATTTVSYEEYMRLWSVAGACIQRTAKVHRQESEQLQIAQRMRMLESAVLSLEAENGRQEREIKRLDERLLEFEITVGRILYGSRA